MNRGRARGCVAATAASLVVALIAAAWIFNTLPVQPTTVIEDVAASPSREPAYINRLRDAGWNDSAATAVVELNKDWFAIQAEENPRGLEVQLKLLEGLGRHTSLQGLLVEHPETAGLLASADDPDLIAAGLNGAVEDYQIVAGLYVQHAAPQDATDLALALKTNRDLICQLRQRGLLGCEVLFIFDRQEASAEEYEAWLRDAIQARFAASDDEFASFANLVMRHGPGLRERLRTNEGFRSRFRSELWPRLTRAIDGGQGMFEVYLDEPRIWDLVALDNGEELLKRCGLLPIDLLFGYADIDHVPYPEVLHHKIMQVLLRREDRTIQALMKFRGEPQFHRLIQRDLPADTLSASLAQLFNAGPNYPERLALYDRLSDEALTDEVGPPPAGVITWVPFYYTIFEVPKKLLQGREPTGMDLFSAAADPVFLVVDIFTGGGAAAGRKALLVGAKESAETATRKIAEKGTDKLLVTTLRDSGLDLARKQIGSDVAHKMGERELVNWRITRTLSEVQQAVQSTIGKATTFEITKPVQFMFQYSRVGRDTWKRWTGIEPRLFMRGDAKVYIRLPNLPPAVLGSRGVAFFDRTAQDLALGTAAESETGKDVTHAGVKHVISANDQLRAWQKNVSAWWLLNSSAGTTPPEQGQSSEQGTSK